MIAALVAVAASFWSVRALRLSISPDWTMWVPGWDAIRVDRAVLAFTLLAAIVAGEIPLVLDPLTTILPHIQSGKLRPLAVTGEKRSAKLPDVPTVTEAGYPKLQSSFWLGVVAPSGTPPAIIDKLNAAFRESLKPPETRARLDTLGAEIKIGTAEEFRQMLAKELALWTSVVKAAKIQVE